MIIFASLIYYLFVAATGWFVFWLARNAVERDSVGAGMAALWVGLLFCFEMIGIFNLAAAHVPGLS